MTLEEEQYYDKYFDLFASDGWKQYITEITDILDGHRIEDIKNEAHLQFLKGERASLFKVVRFENGIRHTYEVLKERESRND